MGKMATFISEFLKDGHLSIPKQIVAALSLKSGEQVRTIIETEKFDKIEFLKLFGIWKSKSESELNIYKEILKERESFGRKEVEI